MIVTESLIKEVIGVVIALVVVVIAYYKWSHQYWRRKNLPFIKPGIPFGNLANPLIASESFLVTLNNLYKKMKENKWKHGGIYWLARPVYCVLDPDYIKNIMAKDFQYFVDRGFYHNEKHDPLSAHLFGIGGTKWRNLRVKLTPTFTSGKMKMMFPILVECEQGLQKQIEEESLRNEPINIKDILARFTTDVIGCCAFGLDCNTCNDPNSLFRYYGNRFLTASGLEMFKTFIALTFPAVAKALALTLTPRDVSNFFTKLVNDTVNYREKNNVTRKDFLQLLIDMKKDQQDEDVNLHDGKTLTMDEIAAQCFVFFVAGFETSSTTMTFTLYELSKHPDIQQKVRDEINTVLAKHDNKITYEAIQDMKYMDQVINEALRKYPPVTFLTRECIKDYKIPDENITIEKGTMVLIPVMGLHYDEEHFSDPDKFDPERFTEENSKSRNRFVYMPFGEGPRMCIGMRFGLMQSKVGLSALLRNYKFSVNKKTEKPLTWKPDSLFLAAKGEIWLNAQKL